MPARNYSGPIDPAAKEALSELQMPDEPDIYEQLIATYLESCKKFLMDLKDPSKRKKTGHSWKSSSASVGAMNLADLCAALEQTPERAELIPQIEAEYAKVFEALKPKS